MVDLVLRENNKELGTRLKLTFMINSILGYFILNSCMKNDKNNNKYDYIWTKIHMIICFPLEYKCSCQKNTS